MRRQTVLASLGGRSGLAGAASLTAFGSGFAPGFDSGAGVAGKGRDVIGGVAAGAGRAGIADAAGAGDGEADTAELAGVGAELAGRAGVTGVLAGIEVRGTAGRAVGRGDGATAGGGGDFLAAGDGVFLPDFFAAAFVAGAFATADFATEALLVFLAALLFLLAVVAGAGRLPAGFFTAPVFAPGLTAVFLASFFLLVFFAEFLAEFLVAFLVEFFGSAASAGSDVSSGTATTAVLMR